MDFKIVRQGGSVIVKIIRFTILSQKHLIFSPKAPNQKLLSISDDMARKMGRRLRVATGHGGVRFWRGRERLLRRDSPRWRG